MRLLLHQRRGLTCVSRFETSKALLLFYDEVRGEAEVKGHGLKPHYSSERMCADGHMTTSNWHTHTSPGLKSHLSRWYVHLGRVTVDTVDGGVSAVADVQHLCGLSCGQVSGTVLQRRRLLVMVTVLLHTQTKNSSHTHTHTTIS